MIAEIEGEYVPLTISERMVQKIWAKGDFRKSDLKTLEGAHLEILDLGQWNLLAEPDFNEQPRPKGRGIRRVRVVYHHVVLCILCLGFERNFLCFPHRRAARP